MPYDTVTTLQKKEDALWKLKYRTKWTVNTCMWSTRRRLISTKGYSRWWFPPPALAPAGGSAATLLIRMSSEHLQSHISPLRSIAWRGNHHVRSALTSFHRRWEPWSCCRTSNALGEWVTAGQRKQSYHINDHFLVPTSILLTIPDCFHVQGCFRVNEIVVISGGFKDILRAIPFICTLVESSVWQYFNVLLIPFLFQKEVHSFKISK